MVHFARFNQHRGAGPVRPTAHRRPRVIYITTPGAPQPPRRTFHANIAGPARRGPACQAAPSTGRKRWSVIALCVCSYR
jgi:hypothetical protein